MVTTAIINGSLGFLMLITYLFTMGDVTSVLKPATGFSFLSAYMNATASTGTTTGLACIILLMEICSAISILATCSRQTFAFARDHALPFSGFFANVNPDSKIPVNSVLATTTITIMLALINIGSTAAFNAIASLTIASLFLSYMICIGCFIYRRTRPEPMPRGRFSLGRAGMPVNIFSFAYLCIAITFSFFPGSAKPTLKDMNWSILVWGAVIIFAIVQYAVHGRRVYEGPVKYVQKTE